MKHIKINKLIKAYLVICDFIIPVPLTLIMFWVWYSKTGNILFTSLIILQPLVFGYLVPGVAARFLRLWEFTWPFRFKYCFYHHGFIYSGYLSFLLWLFWNPQNDFSWYELALSGTYGFIAMMIIGTHHDLLGLKVGMIKNYTKTLNNGESVLKYMSVVVVISFGLVGAFYFLSAYWAYYLFEITSKFSVLNIIIWLLASIVLMTTVLLPYCIQNRSYLRRVFMGNKRNNIL